MFTWYNAELINLIVKKLPQIQPESVYRMNRSEPRLSHDLDLWEEHYYIQKYVWSVHGAVEVYQWNLD